MIKKINICLLCFFSLIFLTGFKEVSAYEFPSYAYYVEIYDTNLRQIRIYIPYNSISSLSIDEDNQIVNIGSSSVTGYFTYNNTDYTVSWSVFDYGRYRMSTSTYTYLNITEIVDTNISFNNEMKMYIYNNQNLIEIIAFLIGGGFLLLLLLKR